MGNTIYTETQLIVEKIINELGYRTNLEVSMGPYQLDIFLPEIRIAVEVDGPQHYKKLDSKRDSILLNEHLIKKVIHVKTVDVIESNLEAIRERLQKEIE